VVAKSKYLGRIKRVRVRFDVFQLVSVRATSISEDRALACPSVNSTA
jgi:hypothetical protein